MEVGGNFSLKNHFKKNFGEDSLFPKYFRDEISRESIERKYGKEILLLKRYGGNILLEEMWRENSS